MRTLPTLGAAAVMKVSLPCRVLDLLAGKVAKKNAGFLPSLHKLLLTGTW